MSYNDLHQHVKLLEDHDLETWRETLRVNVDGNLMCAQAALPHRYFEWSLPSTPSS